MRAAAGEARAINDIGQSVLDRLQQARVILGIVFQIRVLDNYHVAGHVTDGALQRRALAFVLWLKKNFDDIPLVFRTAIFCLQPGQDLAAAIFRAIVDKDYLLRQRHGAHTAHDFLQCALFVVDGNQDRELHCSNSRFLSSRTKAESLGSALTASLIFAWKSAAALSSGLVSTRSPSH